MSQSAHESPPPRRQLPPGLRVVCFVLWWFISLLMMVLAVLGLICVVVGVISFFIEGTFLGTSFGGKAVETAAQKVLFTAVGVACVVAGLGFWWLRQRGYVVAALIVCALLLAFTFAMKWIAVSESI
jgi:hypothetical protein